MEAARWGGEEFARQWTEAAWVCTIWRNSVEPFACADSGTHGNARTVRGQDLNCRAIKMIAPYLPWQLRLLSEMDALTLSGTVLGCKA